MSRILIKQYYGLNIFFHPLENLFKASNATTNYAHKSFNALCQQIKKDLKFKYNGQTAVDWFGDTVVLGCVESNGSLFDSTGRHLHDGIRLYVDSPQVKKIIKERAELKIKLDVLTTELEKHRFIR
jgi:hypothetical protein